MPEPLHKTAATLNIKAAGNISFRQLSAFIFALFLLAACRQPVSNNQAYFDAVFSKVDSFAAKNNYLYSQASMDFLDTAFAKANNPGTTDMVNKYWVKKNYYWSRQQYPLALQYDDSVINLLANNIAGEQNATSYMSAFFSKGDIYFLEKRYDEAINNYNAGKLVHDAYIKDSCVLYEYYNSVANVLLAQQKHLQAAGFYKMRLKMAPVCLTDPYHVFWMTHANLDNIGICYSRAGKTDSAIYFLRAAVDYITSTKITYPPAKENDSGIALAVVYSNLAPLLYKKGDTSGAETLFLKSVEGARLFGPKSTREYQLPLAKFYLENKQVKKAGMLLREIATVTDNMEIHSTVASYYKTAASYYLKINKVDSANTCLLRAFAIEDSLQKRDKNLLATDIGLAFENSRQKASNQVLQKDNELKKEYLLITVIGVIMAFIIALLVWHNLNRQSRYAKKLTGLNNELGRKNDDLHQTLAALEQSDTENNQVMRVVAHDLKNPISAVRSLAYSLLKKEQTEPTREAFELIQATCADSVALIKDLLDNKRHLSEISKELVDMGRLIEQCIELLQIKAGEKNQQLKLVVDYPVMMLNRQKILRVISNIVNNAIKFSPENTEIMISLQRKEETVLLSVKDNGIGIPPGLKDKIFSSNPEKSRPGTAGEESYGLGLSISKKIIEEHAGHFWFESEAGQGSVFYVELPYNVN